MNVRTDSHHCTIDFDITEPLTLTEWINNEAHPFTMDRKLNNMVRIRIPADKLPDLQPGVEYIIE